MKYYIKTFGCQMNFSDSERISTFLNDQGLKSISDKLTLNIKQAAKADLVVLNTCGVRKTAEDRVFSWAHKLKIFNPKVTVIMTGCLAHRKDIQKRMKGRVDLFFPINAFEKFENWIIKNCLKIANCKLQISPHKNSYENNSYLSLRPEYLNKSSIYVPIMTGCNNFCSYCVVPYARGREFSRPIEEIIEEIKVAQKNGCQEITLLGQNVNSYTYKLKKKVSKSENLDFEIDWKFEIGNLKLKRHLEKTKEVIFPFLLDILAQSYPKTSWRFLTSHPKDFSDELIEVIAKNKNIPREIHLPLQSGSDKVLKDMNRPYTKKHYLELIGKIRKSIPGVKITTDMIVGFPTETEKEFQKTVETFKKAHFHDAFINKYSPRPGTAAEKLGDPISWEEKKEREKKLRTYLCISNKETIWTNSKK